MSNNKKTELEVAAEKFRIAAIKDRAAESTREAQTAFCKAAEKAGRKPDEAFIKNTLKKMKITFKNVKQKNHYGIFVDIKMSGKKVGSIRGNSNEYSANFMVYKSDEELILNPNCVWKWITLKKRTETLDEMKNFLKTNFGTIVLKNKIRAHE